MVRYTFNAWGIPLHYAQEVGGGSGGCRSERGGNRTREQCEGNWALSPECLLATAYCLQCLLYACLYLAGFILDPSPVTRHNLRSNANAWGLMRLLMASGVIYNIKWIKSINNFHPRITISITPTINMPNHGRYYNNTRP